MQLEFSNFNSNGTTTGCVRTDTDTQPSFTVTISPNPPVHGSSALHGERHRSLWHQPGGLDLRRRHLRDRLRHQYDQSHLRDRRYEDAHRDRDRRPWQREKGDRDDHCVVADFFLRRGLRQLPRFDQETAAVTAVAVSTATKFRSTTCCIRALSQPRGHHRSPASLPEYQARPIPRGRRVMPPDAEASWRTSARQSLRPSPPETTCAEVTRGSRRRSARSPSPLPSADRPR